MKVDISDVCTIKEFAELLKVHHNTIRKWIKFGRIHAFRVGVGEKSGWRILKTETCRLSESANLDKVMRSYK